MKYLWLFFPLLAWANLSEEEIIQRLQSEMTQIQSAANVKTLAVPTRSTPKVIKPLTNNILDEVSMKESAVLKQIENPEEEPTEEIKKPKLVRKASE